MSHRFEVFHPTMRRAFPTQVAPITTVTAALTLNLFQPGDRPEASAPLTGAAPYGPGHVEKGSLTMALLKTEPTG
ncbi:hypothetical protein AB0M54_38455 [Actinoplanes sp. NPDC051470]|uniref:hypothetical protein n=1 Tax=unclassified Actinoplanes TaxID=2626549 RepID=UPI003427DF87